MELDGRFVVIPAEKVSPGASIRVEDVKAVRTIDALSTEFIDNLWRRMRGRSKYSPNRDSIVRVMRAFVAEVSGGKENP